MNETLFAELPSGIAGFASPRHSLSEPLLDTIVGEYARALVKRYIRLTEIEAWDRGRRLCGILAAFAEGLCRFETVWDLSLGHLSAALFRPGLPQQVAAAEFALRLHTLGTVGQWDCSLLEPVRLRCGNLLLPLANRVSVCSSESGLAIEAFLGGASLDLSAVELATVGPGETALTLLTAETLSGPGFIGSFDGADTDPVREIPVANMPDAFIAALSSALAILHEVDRSYFQWVAKAVRYIVPLEPVASGAYVSSSNETRPATVCLTACGPAEPLTDILVHEASHQYVYMLTRLGPLDDGSDTSLYYSPLKGTMRPIGRILVAYHAVANMLLWSAVALNSGVEDKQFFSRNIALLQQQAQDLDAALASTPALTPIGRLLWETSRLGLHDGALL